MSLYFDVVSTWEQYDGTYLVVQPRSGRVRGRCSYTEACNSPFQGLAADAAGETLWRLFLANMDPRSALYGCGQVLFAHDENVTEAPIGREEEVRAEQDRIMIDTFARWCPDVPIKVESFIADYYTKEAPKVTVAA
jgi:DNA polymerase I-like protein with 3'-5' exonuclease and polymerase domains